MLEQASHWKTALEPDERSMPSSSQYVWPSILSLIRDSTSESVLLPESGVSVLDFLEGVAALVSL